MSAQDRRVKRPVLKSGRTKHGPPFVMIYHHVLDCDAYRSLSPVARCVYTMLRRRFNGQNNGHVHASARAIADELHCSKDTGLEALRILEDRGFIKLSRRSSFGWKEGKAHTWILTEEAFHGELPTREFLKWRAPEKTKTRSREEDKASPAKDTSASSEASE